MLKVVFIINILDIIICFYNVLKGYNNDFG